MHKDNITRYIMLKKLSHILYGIRLIATWTLIVLALLEGYYLVREFSIHASTRNVVLGEAEYRQYSNEYTLFKVSVDGNGQLRSLQYIQRDWICGGIVHTDIRSYPEEGT